MLNPKDASKCSAVDLGSVVSLLNNGTPIIMEPFLSGGWNGNMLNFMVILDGKIHTMSVNWLLCHKLPNVWGPKWKACKPTTEWTSILEITHRENVLSLCAVHQRWVRRGCDLNCVTQEVYQYWYKQTQMTTELIFSAVSSTTTR